MRTYVLLVASVLACVQPTLGQTPSETATTFADGSERLLPYSFEATGVRFADLVTLQDGSKQLGKAMEWADQVLLYAEDGSMRAFSVSQVDQFEFRRSARHAEAPSLADLTVAFVERLPRDASWHGHVVLEDGLPKLDVAEDASSMRPAPGTPATFRIHVRNAGAVPSTKVACRVTVDGQEIQSAIVPGLAPGAEHVIDAAWAWQEGPNVLRVELDPDGAATESLRWNNVLEERVQALGVTVVVARSRYEAFRKVRNVADSFCFEDWVRYQLASLNGLFAASKYPSSPQGVRERVRCDRIVIVDEAAGWSDRSAWEPSLRRGGQADGLAEYTAVLFFGGVKDARDVTYDALRMDWSQLQDLVGQLGLIDLTATDTTVGQCLVMNWRGRYVQRQHVFPYRPSFMYAAGGFPLSERCVAALNGCVGRPRGFRGTFLYQTPATVTVEVHSNSGLPLQGAEVDVFQLMSEGEFAGAVAGAGRGEPLYSGPVDERGRFTLLSQPAAEHQTPDGFELRPNAFGQIATDESNGLLLLRLRQGRSEEYHFLRLYDCNLAYLRGAKDEYVHRIDTSFGDPEAPAAPPYTQIKVTDRSTAWPAVEVCWRLPEGSDLNEVDEFRIYKRVGLAGEDARPWTLADIVRREGGRWNLCVPETYFKELRCEASDSLDTSFAVSVVDMQGRESSLSPPGCLVYDKDSVSLAMTNDMAIVSLAGDGPSQLLCWDGEVGAQHYGVRTLAKKGYEPHFGGLVVGADGRLVVADPVNNVLAFYDRGVLTDVVPDKPWWPGYPSDEPGEFYAPTDVAVDTAGRLYVADRQNNRVQILDPRGQFQAMLDEGFSFEGPHAVGRSFGHLCVTDQGGTRCRVYDIEADPPTFVCQLPPLVDADRALFGKGGKVYVAARASEEGSTGILVFAPKDGGFEMERIETQDIMGAFHRPRGLYLYPGGSEGWSYFVNEFPFDVHRVKAE